MKKLITWLSKGTKIIKILTYLYTGLVVAKSAIASALETLTEVKPDLDQKVVEILQQVVEYVGVAADAIKKVLEWFGVDTKAIDVKASNKDELSAQLKEESQKLKELL